jgi:hypothetical protein
MRTHLRGDAVAKGTYVGPWLDVQLVGKDGDPLEGVASGGYVRVPPVLLLALSPILGAIFVLAFPLVVLAALAVAAGQHAVTLLRPHAEDVSLLARVRYQPAAAWLDEPRPETGPASTTDELADLRAEVQRRRAEDEA